MKVAAVQMVSSPQVATNLERARALLAQAAKEGAELAVLPEYFCLLGQRDTDKLAVQESFGDGPIQQFLAQSAREFGLWVVGGTLPLSLPIDQSGTSPTAKVSNTSLAFSPQGQCIARYDKIHLFQFDNGQESYDESRVLVRGATPVCFDLPSVDGTTWRIGMSVCYDLRFPELYRLYAAQGAHVLLVPSAFTHTTGQAHWEVLLRARAIENLAFVVASAQGGLHDNGRRTWGHSMGIDPWGEVLNQLPQGEGVVLCDLARESLDKRRANLPALSHCVL